MLVFNSSSKIIVLPPPVHTTSKTGPTPISPRRIRGRALLHSSMHERDPQMLRRYRKPPTPGRPGALRLPLRSILT